MTISRLQGAPISAAMYFKAAYDGDSRVIQQYISENMDNPDAINIRMTAEDIKASGVGHQGYRALDLATYSLRYDVIKLLAALPSLEIHYPDSLPLPEDCEDPLFFAILLTKEKVECLLHHPKANLNRKNEDGETLLLYACKKVHRDVGIIECLLAKPNLDVNTGQPLGEFLSNLPKLQCDESRKINILQLFINHPNLDLQALMTSWGICYNKSLACYPDIWMQLFSRPGIPINSRGNFQMTPLMWVASLNNENANDLAVKTILKHPDLDINLSDRHSATALMRAISMSNIKIVRALCERADLKIDYVDKEGNTALMKAAERGSFEIVSVVLDKQHPDITIKNQAGKTAEELAANDDIRELIRKSTPENRRVAYIEARNHAAERSDEQQENMVKLSCGDIVSQLDFIQANFNNNIDNESFNAVLMRMSELLMSMGNHDDAARVLLQTAASRGDSIAKGIEDRFLPSSSTNTQAISSRLFEPPAPKKQKLADDDVSSLHGLSK